MHIKEVMSPDVKLIDPNMKVSRAASLMRDHDIGALPVGENDRLVGMLTDRDIVVRGLAEGKDLKTAKVRDVMSSKVLYCFDDQSMEEVAALMGTKQVRRLPVINHEKRMVGMVSLGDLARGAPADATGEALKQISRNGHH